MCVLGGCLDWLFVLLFICCIALVVVLGLDVCLGGCAVGFGWG